MTIGITYENDGSVTVTCGGETAIIPAWRPMTIGSAVPPLPPTHPKPAPRPMPEPRPMPKIPSAPPSLPSVYVYLPNMIDYSMFPSLRAAPTVLDIQRGRGMLPGYGETMIVPGWRPGAQCVDVRVLPGQSFDLGALNQYIRANREAPLRLWMTGETES